jgi:bifunctional non-homologous end joining protein LigD
MARKAMLGKILAKALAGIQFSEHLAGDGAAIFAHACKLGCEGIVSKRADSAYRSGPSKVWLNAPVRDRTSIGAQVKIAAPTT